MGLLLPALAQLVFLVHPLLMALLFISFLNINWRDIRPKRQHARLLVAQLGIGSSMYLLFREIDAGIAQTLFLAGLASPAVAGVIMIDLMGRNVAFVLSSIVIQTFGIALALPFLMQWLQLPISGFSLLEILGSVFFTISLPMVVMIVATTIYPRIRQLPLRFPQIGLFVFLPLITLAGSRISAFIWEQPAGLNQQLILIALLSALLCAMNFTIGFWLGGSNRSWESSVSLGRKNCMLVVWLGLTFLDPISIVAPMFYLVWQNIINTLQLAYIKTQDRSRSATASS